VFRDEAYTDYTLPVMAALDQIPFIIGFSAKSIFTPRQYVGAVSWSSDDWRFEADVSFNEWSRFPDPYLFIEPNVDIPLVPLTFQDSVRRPPHWHDTVTPRVGFEVRAYEHPDADLLVRAGYFYDNSPSPPQTGYTNQIDNDRHALATSLGVKWSGVGDWRFGAPLTFDLVGQTQYLPKRVAYKNDEVATDNPGYPKIGMSGFLYFVGVSMGASFDYE
jgi:long-subunit fatty acid transport protein